MEAVHKFYDEYYFRPKGTACRILRRAVFSSSGRELPAQRRPVRSPASCAAAQQVGRREPQGRISGG